MEQLPYSTLVPGEVAQGIPDINMIKIDMGLTIDRTGMRLSSVTHPTVVQMNWYSHDGIRVYKPGNKY